jgi:hypothetical protein
VRFLYHISEEAPVFKVQNIVGRNAKLRLTMLLCLVKSVEGAEEMTG